jgi:NTP pyrophosphatase (non-canonical NTP hydrolase)
MTPDEYKKKVLQTESTLFQTPNIRLLHGALGCATEAGEIVDLIKRHCYYDINFIEDNLIEELGDLLWYIAIMADELDISFEELMEMNIKKLQTRYSKRFDKKACENRNYEKEMEAMKNAE